VLGRIPEAVHDGRKLVYDVGQLDVFFIEFITTVFAMPDKTILLPSPLVALDYQANSIGRSAGRMRDFLMTFALLNR